MLPTSQSSGWVEPHCSDPMLVRRNSHTNSSDGPQNDLDLDVPDVKALSKNRTTLAKPQGITKHTSRQRAVDDVAKVQEKASKRPISGRGGPWTDAEVRALYAGIQQHGEGSWTAMLSDPRFRTVLRRRTSCDLKDKWRSCCRKAKAMQSRAAAAALSEATQLAQANATVAYPQETAKPPPPKKKRGGSNNNAQAPGSVRPSQRHPRSSCSGRGGPWVDDEVAALTGGVQFYGEGSWRAILDDSRFSWALRNRTNADLKDKWRVLCRSKQARQQERLKQQLDLERLQRMQEEYAQATQQAMSLAQEAPLEPVMSDAEYRDTEVEDGTLLDVSLPFGSEGAACELVRHVETPLSVGMKRSDSVELSLSPALSAADAMFQDSDQGVASDSLETSLSYLEFDNRDCQSDAFFNHSNAYSSEEDLCVPDLIA